jgi:hypothetical protein
MSVAASFEGLVDQLIRVAIEQGRATSEREFTEKAAAVESLRAAVLAADDSIPPARPLATLLNQCPHYG